MFQTIIGKNNQFFYVQQAAGHSTDWCGSIFYSPHKISADKII